MPGALCPLTAYALSFASSDCALCAPATCTLDPPEVWPAIVGGVIGGLVLSFGLLYAHLKWRDRTKLLKLEAKLEAKLKEFQQSIVNVRAVISDFDPRSIDEPETAEGGGIGTSAAQVALRARWYWQEDAGNISKHSPESVKQPGNFVAYASSVCDEIERAYTKFQQFQQMSATPNGLSSGGGHVDTGTCVIDLADRITSTGASRQKASTSTRGWSSPSTSIHAPAQCHLGLRAPRPARSIR